MFPEEIREIVGEQPYAVEGIGRSDSTVLLFDDMVLKIEAHSPQADATVEMMRWLVGKLPVPEVIRYVALEGKSYLLMRRARGRMCCDAYHLDRAEETAELLAQGLQMLWSVDVSDCPRQFGLEEDLKQARKNVESGGISVGQFHPEAFAAEEFVSPAELLSWLEAHLPEYDPVLSHGDYCLPNVFLDHGSISAFLDLGYTGVADRYRDVATCYRSLKNNLNGTFGGKVYADFRPELLFEKMGMAPDKEKIRYYLLLDTLL